MKLIDAMKLDYSHVSVSCDSRWLYWDEITEEYVVQEKLPYSRNIIVIVRCKSEDLAVEKLIEKQ